MRFLFHMLITSVLAPAIGVGIWTFVIVDWGDRPLMVRVLGSFVGGFLGLVFIAPFTLLGGVLTYGLCRAAARTENLSHVWIWSLGGAVLGLLYGSFFARFVHGYTTLLMVSGVAIGACTGGSLAVVWLTDRDESAEIPQEEGNEMQER